MIRFLAAILFFPAISFALPATGDRVQFDVRVFATCYAYDAKGERVDGYCGPNKSEMLIKGLVVARFEPLGGDAKYMLAESRKATVVKLASGESVSLSVNLALFETAKELGRPLTISTDVHQIGVAGMDSVSLKLTSLRSFAGLMYGGPRFEYQRAGGVIVKNFVTVSLLKVTKLKH